MRKKALRSLTFLTLLAAALSVTGWAVSFVKPQSSGTQAPDNKVRRKTLREIAQERDVEAEISNTEADSEYADLRLLAKNAEAIVIGRILDEESAFDGDDNISTNYAVHVQRVLKDKTPELIPMLRQLGKQDSPAPLATPLKIVRPGGVVNVNGHRASVKVQGTNESLVVGKNYIFFLWWSYAHKAYYLAGGISGVVLVEDDFRVKPFASAKKIKQRYEGLDLETFINEVLN